jgi:hypothetical protein
MRWSTNMENGSTDTRGDDRPEPVHQDLDVLLAELVRKGWQLTFRVIPNDWNAVAEAEILFERMWETEPPRTLQEDMEALKQGLAPQAAVHWRFNPFEPHTIYKAVKRFHHLFVENARTL